MGGLWQALEDAAQSEREIQRLRGALVEAQGKAAESAKGEERLGVQLAVVQGQLGDAKQELLEVAGC